MRTIVLCAALTGAVALAPAAVGDPDNDPGSWPTADHSGYTSPGDPGWVFFRAYSENGQGCGIGPDGTVGCDIMVSRNADGTARSDFGTSAVPGSYACNPPGEDKYSCPLPAPGANQVVADPRNPAHYVESTVQTFTRDVDVLPAGVRLVNGDAWCYVSPASPGGINCRTADNGFLWSSWGGIIGGLS